MTHQKSALLTDNENPKAKVQIAIDAVIKAMRLL